MTENLKPWYAVATPHEDIRAGKLEEAVFAANIWAVVQGTAQGTMAVRLSLGDAAEWCSAAPAKTSGNPPVVGRNDMVDRFTGAPKTAPAAACLLAPRAPLVNSANGAFN